MVLRCQLTQIDLRIDCKTMMMIVLMVGIRKGVRCKAKFIQAPENLDDFIFWFDLFLAGVEPSTVIETNKSTER